MPLTEGYSQSAISGNIAELRRQGYKEEQAIAIAENEARKSRREHDGADHIEEVEGGFRLLSHEGKNLGTFKTRAEAEQHERQVEYFKHTTDSAAAGILYRAGNKVLLMKRVTTSDNGGMWGFPAGKLEDGEEPKQAALREFQEETGHYAANIIPLTQNGSFALFECNGEEFEPKLNDEHTDYMWAAPDDLPSPLHPGVMDVLCGQSAMDRATAREYDINNWPEIKGNPLSKVGIFPYSGKQILGSERIKQLRAEGKQSEIDRIYQVLRPEEELSNPETVESFKLLPWIDDHTMLGRGAGLTPAEKKGVEGVIGEEIYFDPNTDNGVLRGNIKIFSESMSDLVEAGKRELSIGYRCEYDFTPGIWNGKRYDAVQRKIRGNHLALVDQGRMGPDVAVLDHLTFTFDAKELTMADENKSDLEKRLGEAEAEKHALVEKLKKAEDELSEYKEKGGKDKSGKDGETEEERKEREAKDKAKDEAEEEKKREKEAEEKKARDAEEEESKKKMEGMDAALRDVKTELHNFKKDGLRQLQREARERDALAGNLSRHIGTFDHADMTIDEVASYGVKKLGLSVGAGQEVAALTGFLHNRPVTRASVAMDSGKEATNYNDYFAKIKA